jgi:hypothetical protein
MSDAAAWPWLASPRRAAVERDLADLLIERAALQAVLADGREIRVRLAVSAAAWWDERGSAARTPLGRGLCAWRARHQRRKADRLRGSIEGRRAPRS